MEESQELEELHVLDLPQLYTKPSATSLLSTLRAIAVDVPSWDRSAPKRSQSRTLNPTGLPAYLTSIIASPLSWIENEHEKEQIWDLASKRLTERSGRTAMSRMTRSFQIPADIDATDHVEVSLHEPSLTSDNLGLKTWAASYLLAKRLAQIAASVPDLNPPRGGDAESPDEHRAPRILELGSGTGLVGIAAAAVWGQRVHLTDLPAIEPNLAANVQANKDIIDANHGVATTGTLDWSAVEQLSHSEQDQYGVILAADPLYSPEHPKMLVDTIERWLRHDTSARVIVELPIREAYLPEIKDFRRRMRDIGLEILEEGEEVGFDDWSSSGGDGSLTEVRCWWGLWSWTTSLSGEQT